MEKLHFEAEENSLAAYCKTRPFRKAGFCICRGILMPRSSLRAQRIAFLIFERTLKMPLKMAKNAQKSVICLNFESYMPKGVTGVTVWMSDDDVFCSKLFF